MSIDEQFRHLTRELATRKDRIRNLAEAKHHQTDGEWKESLLRGVLQRHLPKSFEAIRGFVTDGAESTGQIDVLVYDNRKPMRLREGDLAFVTPDAVAGIIEVKSAISSISKLETALQPLASNIEKVRKCGGHAAFAGLYAFETKLSGFDKLGKILHCVHKVANGIPERIVNLVSLGDSVFILHWKGPEANDETRQPRWYAYNLPEMAPGYFISNIIHSLAPDSVERYVDAWFPRTPPKDPGFTGEEDLGFGVAVHVPTKYGSF